MCIYIYIHIFHGDIGDIHENQVMPLANSDVSHGGPLELGTTRPGLSGRRVLEGETGHAGGWGTNGGIGVGIEPAIASNKCDDFRLGG